MRHFTFLDQACMKFDEALRTVFGEATHAREVPVASSDTLSTAEMKHSAGLMRVNHTGEVCAQALYSAQALFSRNENVRQSLVNAAKEEGDHLYWCQKRLVELNSHTSYLNVLWYVGSYSIGLAAAAIGDKWSMGFVAETEAQVVAHIDRHLTKISKHDTRSIAILTQMRIDESQHKEDALLRGAVTLPKPIKYIMKFTSSIMVKTAYYI